MMRIFTFIALAVTASLSFASSLVDRVSDFAFSLLPSLASASAPFVIDNSHPRSPLASMRAGMA